MEQTTEKWSGKVENCSREELLTILDQRQAITEYLLNLVQEREQEILHLKERLNVDEYCVKFQYPRE